jgi:hypothetical protein
MTVTITETSFYLGVVLFLLVAQVYHQIQIKKLEKDAKQLWEQISILVVSISAQMLQQQKELNEKQDKK